MSRLDDVFEALHDLILERFRAERGGEIGKAFVAFEFGTPIPDDTFRLKDESRTLSPELAIEFLSQHANTVPEVKDMLFRRRPYTVEAQYGLMLAGASPIDGSSMELLGAVKREATADFDQRLGSLIGPYRYRPVYATPVNWYDAAHTENWTHVAIDRRDTAPPEGTPPLNPKLHMWRLAPQAMQPALAHPVSLATIQRLEVTAATQSAELVKRPRLKTHVTEQPEFQRMIVHHAEPMAGAMARARTFEAVRAPQARFDARRLGRDTAVSQVALHNPASRFAVALGGAAATPPAAATPVAPVTMMTSLLSVNASFQLAKAIEADATPQQVVSDQFGITVDICLVNLHRPWLSDALLTLPGWFVPGFVKGEFSDADGEEDGPFAVLPTACILIRNLQIKAEWSDQDSGAIEHAANLGGFNLFGREFDRNTATLVVKGMQSIAWVCEPMPLLPPAGAP